MSKVLDVETQKSFDYLQEVEKVAQKVLVDKQTKLELANAQNKYREAYRALQQVEDRQSWIKLGTVYVKLPTEECKNMLKEEIDTTGKSMDSLQETIKENLQKLRDLEHEPRLEGYGLKPLSAAEAKAINKAFNVQ